MKMADIKKKTEKDLYKELQKAREALREFRFGSAGSHTRDTKEGRELKKTIARILTELNQRVKSNS